MAWNGGVSLAVWMAGAAVEFDCARRAHAGPDDAGDDGAPVPRTLYTTLLDAFDRRLVIDILAGASAGGINGGLMASAIRHNRRLHPGFVRERWLALGDFGSLLQPASAKRPPSLMRGDAFYRGLLDVFRTLQDPSDAGAGGARVLVPEDQLQTLSGGDPVLDVQVTTVEGEPHSFTDQWSNELIALEYRTPVRFRKQADFDKPETLATAARASASFPFAFEPTQIDGDSATLAGLDGGRRWALDGGLLENAPIRQALDLIPTRPASGPVRRYVCYVNAAPQARPPLDPKCRSCARCWATSSTCRATGARSIS
jgi:patatin-related protein